MFIFLSIFLKIEWNINVPALSRLSAFVSILFTISFIFFLCSPGLSFLISSVSYKWRKLVKQRVSRWWMKLKSVKNKYSQNEHWPGLPAGLSGRVQGCAAGQCSDLHEDASEKFVQVQTEETATAAVQRTPSVDQHNECNKQLKAFSEFKLPGQLAWWKLGDQSATEWPCGHLLVKVQTN